MKNSFLALVTIFLTTSLSLSFAEPSEDPRPLDNQINKILREFGPNLSIGMIVENLNTGAVLYQKNPNRYYMPASNQKLFTALAALEYLGPQYVYQTRLFVDTTKIQNGVLNDNIYLQFSGDPNMSLDQLDRLIATLRQVNIHRINGNIIVDDTAFDNVSLSPGTSWEDQNYCFGAPLSSLIVNHNCVSAMLKPAEAPDKPAILSLPSQAQFIRYISHVKTGESSAENCIAHVENTNETTYTINGCIKTSDSMQTFSLPIHNPQRNMQATLTYLLNKNFILYSNDIKFQKITAKVPELAHAESPPLQLLVNTMLKESDNLIANALFKTMGEVYSQRQGSWQSGTQAMRVILAKAMKDDFSNLPLIDGSGSSRYNFVTPQQIIDLLRKAYSQPYRNVFMSGLPIAGVDGTLKYRLKDPLTIGKIYAKTGTMTAVTSLSGYLITHNQQTLIFTIMINGFVGAEAKYKELEDQLCHLLVDVE